MMGDPSMSIRHVLLTSWTLWHFLLHPDDHPLFRQTLSQPTQPLNTLWIVPLVGVFACCGSWVFLVPMRSSIFILLPILLTAFSSCYVSTWVMGISGNIVRKHERRIYDQLAVTPLGALGVSWVLCSATLHRGDTLGWSTVLRALLAGLLLFAQVVFLATITLQQNATTLFHFLLLLFEVTALAASSYIDHIQSVVLGSLAGILAPTFTKQSVGAHLLAEALFLILQCAVCLAVFIIPMVGQFGLDWMANHVGFILVIDPLALSLSTFYLTREAIIVALWGLVLRRLN
jgi:hypothetical protein